MQRRPAVPIDPPAVLAGTPRCPCCDGPLGPKSWEIPMCITCWEATEGRRADPTVYQVQGLKGTWRTVKFTRKHTRCPLQAAEAPGDAAVAGGTGLLDAPGAAG